MKLTEQRIRQLRQIRRKNRLTIKEETPIPFFQEAITNKIFHFDSEEDRAYVARLLSTPWDSPFSWFGQRLIRHYGVSSVFLEDESSFFYCDALSLAKDIVTGVRGAYFVNEKHEKALKEWGFQKEMWEALRVEVARYYEGHFS